MLTELMRRLELGALLAVMLVLQCVLFLWLVLRGIWMAVWGTWACFWHAALLYTQQGYRWSAAWRMACRALDSMDNIQP